MELLRPIAGVHGGSDIKLADYLASATFLFDIDKRKLRTLADWCLPADSRRRKGGAAVFISSFVERGQRESADAFFSAMLGLHFNMADRLLGVTSPLVDGPIALIAYQLHAVESSLVAYVSLLATRPGKATDVAVDKERWRGRGLGRLLLHLVARIAQVHAGCKPVFVELQCDRRVKGLCSFYESCGFFVVNELATGTVVWDGFTRLRWSPGRTPAF
jgi:GNAT superfamily N-acetyltransferase